MNFMLHAKLELIIRKEKWMMFISIRRCLYFNVSICHPIILY